MYGTRSNRPLLVPRLALAIVLLLLVAPRPSSARPDPQEQEHPHDHASPYAEQEDSGIAALSLQELRDLENGEGMGLARAAELNRYPGPKHVLELGEVLELTDEQRATVEESRLRMLAEARRLGAAIIERERELDRRFAHGHVDAAMVRESTAEIGGLQAELRATHLLAHLETRALLTEEQVRAYDQARGYGSEASR